MKAANKVGICALCKNESYLQISHLVPKFVHRILKNNDQTMIKVDNIGERKVQDSMKEYLLCSNCEMIMNKYETYVANFIHKGIKNLKEHQFYFIANINYKNFKLFYLSILWKLAASKDRYVQFGNFYYHKDLIAKLILNEDPGGQFEYNLILLAINDDINLFENDENSLRGFYDVPTHSYSEGWHYYTFVLLGFVWVVCISNHQQYNRFKYRFSLRPTGKLIIHKYYNTSDLVKKRYLSKLKILLANEL
ncbi:MAG: hypothetical protein EPN82_06750 [Bacteroidetes bacterium]|nr:MAG: hypothetical protein EPN82_06750 [Bacteroidota bacterium]